MTSGDSELISGVAAAPQRGRLPLLDRSDAIALSHLLALASELIDWDELADSIEEFIAETEVGCWYAPTSTAALLRSYYLRRWFALNAQELDFLLPHEPLDGPQLGPELVKRFDHFFEHYQLKDIVQPQIEHQWGMRRREPSCCSCASESRA